MRNIPSTLFSTEEQKVVRLDDQLLDAGEVVLRARATTRPKTDFGKLLEEESARQQSRDDAIVSFVSEARKAPSESEIVEGVTQGPYRDLFESRAQAEGALARCVHLGRLLQLHGRYDIPPEGYNCKMDPKIPLSGISMAQDFYRDDNICKCNDPFTHRTSLYLLRWLKSQLSSTTSKEKAKKIEDDFRRYPLTSMHKVDGQNIINENRLRIQKNKRSPQK